MFIRYFLGAVFIFLSASTDAAIQPRFLIIPTTSTNVSISSTNTATVQYRVTNQTAITRQLTIVSVSGITQILGGDGYCSNPFTLAHGQSCLLTLQINGSQFSLGTTTKAVEVCKTNPDHYSPNPFLCSKTNPANHLNITVSAPIPPRLSVTPRVLDLAVNGVAGELIISNLSSNETASNIRASFDGTSLEGNVIQNASNCLSVSPGKTCSLVFTPGSAAVSLTPFKIQGDYTYPTAAAIRISDNSVAEISVAGSPLILNTGGAPGTLTVKNHSTTVTATNVQALLSPQVAASVTQNATDCATLAPEDTCSLVFTPTTSMLDPTHVTIIGNDSSQTSTVIAVNASTQARIDMTAGSPLTLKADGNTTGTMTITNLSSSITAHNVTANFTGTNLAGNVTATTCSSIAPGNSCTITFTPGTTPVVSTSFSIYGSNTSALTGQLAISSYAAYLTNTSSDSVTRCNISLADGVLSGCSTVLSSINSNPAGIAFNSAGTYAYIPIASPAAVVACAVDGRSGALSSCATTTLISGSSTSANGIVYNSQLGIIYLTLSTDSVYQCSLNANGSIASCSDSGATNLSSPQGIAINPAGTIAYIANLNDSTVTQCHVSLSTGNLSECVTNTGMGSANIGMAIDPTNAYAYVTNGSSNGITWGSINQADGSLTLAGSLTVSGVQNATGTGLNSVTHIIYIANGSNNMVMQCSIDSTTGAVSACSSSGATELSFPYGVGLYPTPP